MGFLQRIARWFIRKAVSWRELGTVTSTFTSFGGDAWRSDVVRSCVRPLADFTSKAEAKSSNAAIARLLNERPNLYMTGPDFLQKCRTRYELTGTVMVYMLRDDRGLPCSFYPVPYSRFEAVEYQGELYIEFSFANGSTLTAPWEDLAVCRKDYFSSDIAGDRNDAILSTLELLNVTHQGVANAVKATANLRGILKNTKAILATEDVKKQRDQFVRDYLSLENEGGIASLDATQEFIPIKMEPSMATAEQFREFRQDVQRYFSVSDKVVTGDMTPDEIEGFYTIRIEPWLVKFSQALTTKAFTPKARGYGNYIIYESNKLQFASLDKKITYYKEIVLNGGASRNEWRKGCNLAPIDGGDVLICRLDVGVMETGKDERENED